MQEKNVLALEYLDDGERIPDLINVVYFQGEEIVRSEEVQEMDSEVQKIRKVWGKANIQKYSGRYI